MLLFVISSSSFLYYDAVHVDEGFRHASPQLTSTSLLIILGNIIVDHTIAGSEGSSEDLGAANNALY